MGGVPGHGDLRAAEHRGQDAHPGAGHMEGNGACGRVCPPTLAGGRRAAAPSPGPALALPVTGPARSHPCGMGALSPALRWGERECGRGRAGAAVAAGVSARPGSGPVPTATLGAALPVPRRPGRGPGLGRAAPLGTEGPSLPAGPWQRPGRAPAPPWGSARGRGSPGPGLRPLCWAGPRRLEGFSSAERRGQARRPWPGSGELSWCWGLSKGTREPCLGVGLQRNGWRLAASSAASARGVYGPKKAAGRTRGLFDAVGGFCFILIGGLLWVGWLS